MERQRSRIVNGLIFIILAVILFNAVYFTALIMYVDGVDGIQIKMASILFNISLLPTIRLMMPICRERTLYQEKAFMISARAVTLGMLIFIALMWIVEISDFKFWEIIVFYAYWIAVSSIYTAVYRWCLKRHRLHGGDYVNVIVMGDGPTAKALCEELKGQSEYGYKVLGYLGSQERRNILNVKWLGTSRDLKKVVGEKTVDQLYYITTNDNSWELNEVIEVTSNNFVDLYFVPPMGKHSMRRFSKLESSNGFITLTFKGNRLESPVNKAIKRVFDLVFSSLVILILGIPLFLPIAIAVKLSSPGPILFRQKRNGYHGKVFDCYKFRSMVVNNRSNEASTARNDKRITKVGRFIRRTSLDELPQFFNVFLGDMSVVGPRPHIVKQTEDYKVLLQNYMVRHRIKPGISGWAQINKLRGTTETLDAMEKRVRADIWYIDNWSLVLDIKIILRTVYNILFTHDDGAY